MQLYNMDRLGACPSGPQVFEETSEKCYEMA